MKLIVQFLRTIALFVLVGTTLTFCSNESENSTDTPNPTVPDVVIVHDTLVLTPNESFFSPVGTLRAHLRDKTSGNIYNKNEYYDYIHEWSEPNDTILYGIQVLNKGELKIIPEMQISENQDASKLHVFLNDSKKQILLSGNTSTNSYKKQNSVVFDDVDPGFYVLKLKIASLESSGISVGQLKNVYVTGTAAKDAEFEMRRYRPYAVHCKWESESTVPIEISVHEVNVTSTYANSYQPITTPFGYTGSPWSLDSRTFSGYNFSLWSYGQNDPIPPFYQESHLIAVGPGLEFGAYGHEGTGVKPRGMHPYVDIDTNTQTIAVRKVPGEVYDTYWSYYLDPNDGHWKLFGCGKKYNKSGELKALDTGAFLEVAGGASKERSGHELREVKHRGWQRDTLGNWYPIHKMIGTTNQNDISFRDWKLEGNKFVLQMGGWGAPGIEKKTLELSNPDPVPDFLKGSYEDELFQMPAVFDHSGSQEITTNSARLKFNVTNLGTNASAKVFWGPEEGLTKEEKWAHNKTIPITQGENSFQLDGLSSNTSYYFRIKVVNNEGITWSFDTQSFTTNE